MAIYFGNNKVEPSGIGKVYFGNNKTYEKEEVIPNYLCFTANHAGSTVELYKVGWPDIANTAYSLDGKTWNSFSPSTTVGTNIVTLSNIGDKVYFRNDIKGDFDESDYLAFDMTGSIAASGNINSIYLSTRFDDLTTLVYKSCYNFMFYLCSSLTTPPELPATTLADSCYRSMFAGCTNLTQAPELPATELSSACYDTMFDSCISLTSAPALPATTCAEWCYSNMFYNCSSLTQAPELPATTLAQQCYYFMFSDCTSLTTVPELPATRLVDQCYSRMFYGCTSLTTAPELPATALADWCYESMFSGCTSLISVPSLPATALADASYMYMFYGCTSLQVSDSQTAEAPYAWRIPAADTFTNSFLQTGMFANCLGTRSSDTLDGEEGYSYTYYTQNRPVVAGLYAPENVEITLSEGHIEDGNIHNPNTETAYIHFSSLSFIIDAANNWYLFSTDDGQTWYSKYGEDDPEEVTDEVDWYYEPYLSAGETAGSWINVDWTGHTLENGGDVSVYFTREDGSYASIPTRATFIYLTDN